MMLGSLQEEALGRAPSAVFVGSAVGTTAPFPECGLSFPSILMSTCEG